jgi:hypothetical protein
VRADRRTVSRDDSDDALVIRPSVRIGSGGRRRARAHGLRAGWRPPPVAWSRPTDRRVRLDDYFVDKYEVNNQEYKEFVNAGGYVKREYWTRPFLKDGRTLSWDEAVRTLVDRTGLPGPRSWSNQNFPEDKADHPATDVTWYEADAYATFRGKQLATIFQWEKAARNGYIPQAGVATMPWGVLPGRFARGSREPAPARGRPPCAFGMSAFGAYNMAGTSPVDVERQLRRVPRHRRRLGDPTYDLAGRRAARLLQLSSGFRCVRLATSSVAIGWGASSSRRSASVQGDVATGLPRSRLPIATKTPLDARIEQTYGYPVDARAHRSTASTARARRVSLPPHNAPRPLQVIHLIPAGDVAAGFRPLPDAMDDRMAPFVKAGRAAFGVVLEGYVERLRPAGAVLPDSSTVEFAEMIVSRLTELRRGLDYLDTRTDIDTTRMAALAPSAGSRLGLILGAVETRYRAFVFVGAGLSPADRGISAAANPINFAPHIRAPKLIVQGRYDEDTPARTQSGPLFKLLPEPKWMTLYDGGHVPSIEVIMNATSAWLEKQLGRVSR